MIDELINRIRAQAEAQGTLPRCATAAAVARAEAELGFSLPPFYVALVTAIADGGFGPGEQGLLGAAQLVEGYLDLRDEGMQPRAVVPLCTLGNLALDLDCITSDGRVLASEIQRTADAGYHLASPSLRGWLERWLEGFDLEDECFEIVGHEERRNPFTGTMARYPVRRWRGDEIDLGDRSPRGPYR